MEHLIEKYKPLVRAKARSYFLVGADREDIVQEGMIGLFKAVRDYKYDKKFRLKCLQKSVLHGKSLLQLKQQRGKAYAIKYLCFT